MRKTVYHGTASDDIEKLKSDIILNGFLYKYRDDHWLGQGIYFFDNPEWAKLWATQPINNKKDKIIFEAEIFCKDSEFLDLDLPSVQSKITDKIIKITKEIVDENILLNVDENKKRCFYLDVIKKQYGYKIIKHTFPLNNKNYTTSEVGLYLSQIQYCVSSNINISNVKVNEHTKINNDKIRRRKNLK